MSRINKTPKKLVAMRLPVDLIAILKKASQAQGTSEAQLTEEAIDAQLDTVIEKLEQKRGVRRMEQLEELVILRRRRLERKEQLVSSANIEPSVVGMAQGLVEEKTRKRLEQRASESYGQAAPVRRPGPVGRKG